MIASPLFRLFLGAFCISWAPILVKFVAMAPTPIGVYRCLIASLVLLAISTRRGGPRLPARLLPVVLLTAAFFAADLYVWHRAVIYAGAGLGTILGNTQVFYVTLFGILFLKEPPSPQFWLAVGLAFVGIFLLVTVAAPSAEFTRGIGFGLATGVFYAGFILYLRHLGRGRERTPPETLLGWVCFFCGIVLAGISAVEGTLRAPIGSEWPALLALAVIAQVCGWSLITRNVGRVPVAAASLMLLTQPVIATLLGALLYGERLAPTQLAGAAVTLLAIYLGTHKPSFSAKARPADTLRESSV